jgi:uncharacterized protein
MTKEIIEKVKEFVIKEFEKPEAKDKESLNSHFIPVVEYAKKLAEENNADKEIVEIASWLHDIGSIRGDYENHHISSSKIAEQLLSSLNYPREKIEIIKNCILTHRGSIKMKRDTKEAQILADADALTHFDAIDELLRRGYGNTQPGDKQKLLIKIERSYNKLSVTSKPLVKDKLEKARKQLT